MKNLSACDNKILLYVRQHPGRRVSEIAKALGLGTKNTARGVHILRQYEQILPPEMRTWGEVYPAASTVIKG